MSQSSQNELFQAQAPTETSSSVSEPPPSAPKPKKRRGFAAMDPQRVSEIASKGGKAAHAAGTAHEFTRDEAREAGRKGGYATHAKRKERVAPAESSTTLKE